MKLVGKDGKLYPLTQHRDSVKPWGGLNVDYSHEDVRTRDDVGQAYIPGREPYRNPCGCSAANVAELGDI